MAANFGSLPQKSRAARTSVDGSAPCAAAHSTAMSKNPEIFRGRKPFALVAAGFDQIQEHSAVVPVRICANQRAEDRQVRRGAGRTQTVTSVRLIRAAVVDQ